MLSFEWFCGPSPSGSADVHRERLLSLNFFSENFIRKGENGRFCIHHQFFSPMSSSYVVKDRFLYLNLLPMVKYHDERCRRGRKPRSMGVLRPAFDPQTADP
ncbi:hypothetical protein TWF718_010909 [Orbilia javanica]|uniref:Uncharacterized protein n=1 Tax=Orbilia javanica TaxID=47235 RepID=A0AAN8MKG4_9PEZI